MRVPIEQLVEGNKGQHGGLDWGQPEVIPEEGGVALHDLALAGSCTRHEVANDAPDLVPQLDAWPVRGRSGQFTSVRHSSQPSAQCKSEVLFVGHSLSPSFRQRCLRHTSEMDRRFRIWLARPIYCGVEGLRNRRIRTSVRSWRIPVRSLVTCKRSHDRRVHAKCEAISVDSH